MVAEDRDAPVPMAAVIARELEIRGSHGMAAQAYPTLLAMIREGKLDPQRLVGKTVTLAEAPAALIALGSFGGTGVTVIDRFDAAQMCRPTG